MKWYYRLVPRWLDMIIFRQVYRIEYRTLCVKPAERIVTETGEVLWKPAVEVIAPIEVDPGKYWWQFWKRV